MAGRIRTSTGVRGRFLRVSPSKNEISKPLHDLRTFSKREINYVLGKVKFSEPWEDRVLIPVVEFSEFWEAKLYNIGSFKWGESFNFLIYGPSQQKFSENWNTKKLDASNIFTESWNKMIFTVSTKKFSENWGLVV